MPDSPAPNPEAPAKAEGSSTVRTTLITVIGSVVVALITTMGTIWSHGSEIQANAQKIDALKSQADALTKRELPVGTVVASLLTPVEFAKEVGDPASFDVKTSKWTLANGKSVSGTRWAELRADAPVPNLCGMFLRGKNHGKDPNLAEIDLGQPQADSVGQHKHIQRVFDPSAPDLKERVGGGILWNGGYRFTDKVDIYVQGIATDDARPETRPKNVTVNYFIRINN
jgi:hypothetical protein